jgi:hypothetical protein
MVLSAEPANKKFYYEDSSSLNFTLNIKSKESLVIVLRNLNENSFTVLSWVDFKAGDAGDDHEITVKISEITSQRYQLIFPPIDEDIPADLKKEYYEGLEKIKLNDTLKRALFSLNLEYTENNDTIWRGGFNPKIEKVIMKEVPDEKIGPMAISHEKDVLLITLPLVKESRDMQIIKGNTERIRELFKSRKWEYLHDPKVITLYKK